MKPALAVLPSLDELPLGVVIFDHHQRIVRANSKVKKFFGSRVSLRSLEQIIDFFPVAQLTKVHRLLRHFWLLHRAPLRQAYACDHRLALLPLLHVNNKFLQGTLSTICRHGAERFGVIYFDDVTHFLEIDRMKDEFLSVASHELRTPLTAIMGNVDMVLKGQAGPISDEVQEYLEDVLLGADRLISLVNDMLDVSRLEAGRMVFKLQTIDLRATIAGVVKEINFIARAKNISLFFKAPRTATKVIVDPNKMVQVLDNLIGNAIKFTDRGGVTVVLRSVTASPARVVVDIKDTGIGIPPEEQKKLFKKFSQLDSSAAREAKGTGLGLYVTKNILDKLGGKISVFSAGQGKGTTFSFTLPAAHSHAAQRLQRISSTTQFGKALQKI